MSGQKTEPAADAEKWSPLGNANRRPTFAHTIQVHVDQRFGASRTLGDTTTARAGSNSYLSGSTQLQIGKTLGGCFGNDRLQLLMIGCRFLLGQNCGAPMAFRQAAFQ